MRVLHITPYFAPAFGFGGPPQSILTLCKALIADGVDVEVFTTTANPGGDLAPNSNGTEYEGVPVRYFPVDSPRLLLGSRALRLALGRAASRADVIHVHGLWNATSWTGAAVARRHQRPLFVSIRGMLEPAALRHHRWRKRLAWLLFDRRTLQGATKLHCTSAQERRAVERAGYRRIVEIPNAVDVALGDVSAGERATLRQRLQIPESAPVILFLGRLHRIKRLDLLATAFATVARARDDVHLVIAGEGESVRREDIARLAGDAAARLHWAGPVYLRQRDVLLTTASALVLCSDSENFGMSVAEALSAGVPPVVTRTCPWEMIERAQAGLWVPQTADAIAAALLELLNSPDVAARMSMRARTLAFEQFGPARVAAQWRAAYEQPSA
jgi:glycosyltransferase involved in cell wall biosynthesis